MKSARELYQESLERADIILNGKGNPNHDPSSGRFTSGPGGGSSSGGKKSLMNIFVNPQESMNRAVDNYNNGKDGILDYVIIKSRNKSTNVSLHVDRQGESGKGLFTVQVDSTDKDFNSTLQFDNIEASSKKYKNQIYMLKEIHDRDIY